MLDRMAALGVRLTAVCGPGGPSPPGPGRHPTGRCRRDGLYPPALAQTTQPHQAKDPSLRRHLDAQDRRRRTTGRLRAAGRAALRRTAPSTAGGGRPPANRTPL